MSDEPDDIVDEELPDEELAEEQPEPAPEVDPEARRAAEENARKYGWRAREEFDRAPKSWVDADRYLELPATHIKMLRDENRAITERLAAAEKAANDKAERLEAQLRATAGRVQETERSRFEAEMAQVERAKREAVQKGDLNRYEQLDTYERSLRPPEFNPEPARDGPPPEVQEFVARNAWAQNPVLMEQARLAVERMPGGYQNVSAKDQLAYAEGQIRQAYPHLFAAPAPTPAPTPTPVSRVDGGGLGTGARRGKSGADLPADARKAGEAFVRDGVFKDLNEYARDYFEDNA